MRIVNADRQTECLGMYIKALEIDSPVTAPSFWTERFTNTEQSYLLVSAALNESRKVMTRHKLVKGSEPLGEGETIEKLNKRKKSSGGVKSSDMVKINYYSARSY